MDDTLTDLIHAAEQQDPVAVGEGVGEVLSCGVVGRESLLPELAGDVGHLDGHGLGAVGPPEVHVERELAHGVGRRGEGAGRHEARAVHCDVVDGRAVGRAHGHANAQALAEAPGALRVVEVRQHREDRRLARLRQPHEHELEVVGHVVTLPAER